MYFEDFTITIRETLVAVAITLVLVGLGFLICGLIKNNVNESNEKYYKALKINNDEEMFKYAIKTNVRYTLAQGTVKAVEGVSIEDIDGKYFKIRKVKEQYTRHTRQVAHKRRVGNTTQTYYTTEVYWTWDYVSEEEFNTEKFNFLGVDFDYEKIKFNNENYKETKNSETNIRYQYYVIPLEFEGTLFTDIDNNTINKNEFSKNNTIENIIKTKESLVKNASEGFWIVWIIIILCIDFGYVYLDNNYLED